jgi:hypothetical protein
MKKLFALALLLTLSGSLVACGGGGETPPPPPAESPSPAAS